jgi:hypothetical protein
MSTLDTEVRILLHDRRRRLRVAIVAAVAAVAVGVALVTSWPRGGPNVVDRALAALGTAPVIHAVVQYSSPNDVVIDLATGKVRERVHATEYWYDRERSVLHTRLLTDGKMLTEIVETPAGSDSDLGHYPGGIAAQLDPALAGFVTRYREALANGAAQIVGHETVDGAEVTLLRIDLGHGTTEDVAVDGHSYRPLFFTYEHQRQIGPTWHVAEIESVGRDPSYFAKPERSEARPTGSGGSTSREITPREAASALERPSVWLGPSFDGLRLEQLTLAEDDVDYTDGTKHTGRRLELTYGGKSDPLVVGESASVAGSYQLGFNDGGDPPAPGGSLVLEANAGFVLPAGSPRPPLEWTGKLIRNGLYLEIRGPSREIVLAAARALEAMP